METLPAGTQVTCTNGHVVCETAYPLRLHSALSASDFTKWQGIPPPRAHDTIRPCRCGADFIAGSPSGGLRLHTAAGWWPR